MGTFIWDALVGIISLCISLLLWPLGIIIKFRGFFGVVIPYVLLAAAALILVSFVIQVLGPLIRAIYYVLRSVFGLIRAFLPRSASSSQQSEQFSQQDSAQPPPDESDPYYILGVDRSVTASELAARYKQLIKTNHPDKVAQLDPEIRAFAEERSKRIIKAYEELAAGL